ncbi:MAG: hypothetical protein AABX07_01605 [Nanoarchaeota archaeon]|mgnify:CR=1 FL=1
MRLIKLIILSSYFFLSSGCYFNAPDKQKTYARNIYSNDGSILGYRELDFSLKRKEVRIYSGISNRDFYAFFQDLNGDGKVERIGAKEGFFSRKRIIADSLQDYERERRRFDSANKILDEERRAHFLNTDSSFRKY